eukprot:12915715-Prorocentrum_lima.AAC.1
MIGQTEQHTREEANWYLHEHYCDAKRRWRHFTGRPPRKHRVHYRHWSSVRKGAPQFVCATCSTHTHYDIEADCEPAV